MSKNTIASYRQCFKQFISFIEKRTGRTIETLDLSIVTYDLTLDFLTCIEIERGVCAATRNQRAAAIKSFVKCCSLIAPGKASEISHLRHIPHKRTCHKVIDYLTHDELRQLFSQIDLSHPDGFRDFVIIKFMYNTGCRVSEAAGMRLSWLDMQRGNAHVWGKGAKERVIPLFNTTVSFIEIYLRSERIKPEKGYEDVLFINRSGYSFTRSGLYKMIKKYASLATRFNPSFRQKRITPHTLRHTAAVHLMQSGVSYRTIQSWLGHSDMETTMQYAQVDIEHKRKALEKFSTFDNMVLQAFLSSGKFDWNKNPEMRQWLINLQNPDDPAPEK